MTFKRNKQRKISSGSTLLNMALSENPQWGFLPGRMINLIGDSSSGKTLLALSILADCNQENSGDFDLHYADCEQALSFDPALFGSLYDYMHIKQDIITIEDFYNDIKNLIENKKPFIYVLDSFDSLTTIDEQAEISKGYKLHKQKMASEMFRVIVSGLSRTKSILIIISQTRDNIQNFGFGPKKIRSGGRALQFYCSYEIWLSNKKKLVKKNLPIGTITTCKITKNKQTGKVRDVTLYLYYQYGIDDVTSMIEFLLEIKVWSKTGKTIKTNIGIDGTQEKLIKQIENNKLLMDRLHETVKTAWIQREKSVNLDRVPKYKKG